MEHAVASGSYVRWGMYIATKGVIVYLYFAQGNWSLQKPSIIWSHPAIFFVFFGYWQCFRGASFDSIFCYRIYVLWISFGAPRRWLLFKRRWLIPLFPFYSSLFSSFLSSYFPAQVPLCVNPRRPYQPFSTLPTMAAGVAAAAIRSTAQVAPLHLPAKQARKQPLLGLWMRMKDWWLRSVAALPTGTPSPSPVPSPATPSPLAFLWILLLASLVLMPMGLRRQGTMSCLCPAVLSSQLHR